MADVPGTLAGSGFAVYLQGFSAIDSYLRRSAGLETHLLVNADVAELARLFDDLRYPGAGLADAALDRETTTYYFHCVDRDGDYRPSFYRSSFQFLEFYQDLHTRRFFDPRGIYPRLRAVCGKPLAAGTTNNPAWWKKVNAGVERCRALADAAMILARYFPETGGREIREMAELFRGLNDGPPPGIEEQRLLLAGLLSAANPAPGFELLKNGGFIDAFWPELAVLDDVDQSKEFHPEGNAWKHTLETLRYRKAGFDLRLSLGLLLHDVGKPIAESAGRRRFDGHAELGERQARRFLERLGFAPALAGEVCYLVRNHMLPAALPRLPLIRTGEIMASPLFPVLLELYRCDESSSFKGLDGYYESSAAYQSYLKYRRNPYRSADGKKLKREQIAGTQ